MGETVPDDVRRAPAREILVDNGKRLMTLDELARLQPGMDQFMAEIASRSRNVYFAADAGAWEAAGYFVRTLMKHLKASVFSRPKYAAAMETFLAEDMAPLKAAILAQDSDAFRAAWDRMVERVNHYHREFDSGFIVYRTPATAQADLDFSTQG